MAFLNLSAVTLKLTAGITFRLIHLIHVPTILIFFSLTWLGVFPVEIDLSRQPPGVYSLEINATDIFNFSDMNVISYTSK